MTTFKVVKHDEHSKVFGYSDSLTGATNIYGKHYKEGAKIVALAKDSPDESFDKLSKKQ